MLARPHVAPFTRVQSGRIEVDFLADHERVIAFLDRLCRLVRRLEGSSRAVVREALRRQHRRVRDAQRMSGVAKTLLDACTFRPPPGAEMAPDVRHAVFHARGALWPPLPGNTEEPYRSAAETLGISVADAQRLLYADRPSEQILVAAPRWDGRRLLERYNLELARAVLLDAERVVLTARGGWRDIFRAVKLARLMYRLSPGPRRAFRLELTGPAAAFVARPHRYGRRFARVVPALTRAPGWSLEAEVVRGGRRLTYRLDATAPIGRPRRGRPAMDSRWEHSLAADFEARVGSERGGWSLGRESTPVALGEELMLPDFTLFHRDGREALVEIVGFWTPDYLESKLRKVRAAGLEHLILVVYRGLGVGAGGQERPALEGGDPAAAPSEGTDEGNAREAGGGRSPKPERAPPTLPGRAPPGPVIWFVNKPQIGPVLEAAERVARPRAR